MNEFDVLVVGGGAAGLTAAVVLARAGRAVAVVDAGAPRNAPAAHMHGFLSREGMPPADLLVAGRAEAAGYGAALIEGTVAAIDPGFLIGLADGSTLRARKVLIATGLRDEIPAIPGLRERWGRDVLHCPYCHGYEVRDQPLAVIGGTPEAVAHALLLVQWSADVLLFPHSGSLSTEQRERLDARGVRVQGGQVSHLSVQDDRIEAVVLADGTRFARAAVFVRPSFVPDNRLLAGLGCEIDEGGWVRHDSAGRTGTPGVFVAGNAADPRAQVITAAGQGSAAGIAINADLVEDDIAAAVAAHRAC